MSRTIRYRRDQWVGRPVPQWWCMYDYLLDPKWNRDGYRTVFTLNSAARKIVRRHTRILLKNEWFKYRGAVPWAASGKYYDKYLVW